MRCSRQCMWKTVGGGRRNLVELSIFYNHFSPSPAPPAPRRHCRDGPEAAAAATLAGHQEPSCNMACRSAASCSAPGTCGPSPASSPAPGRSAADPSPPLPAAASFPRPERPAQTSPQPSAPEMAPQPEAGQMGRAVPRAGPAFVSPPEQSSLSPDNTFEQAPGVDRPPSSLIR